MSAGDLTSAQRSHNARHRGVAHKVRTRQIKTKRSATFGQWVSECLTCGSSCLYGSRESAMKASQCHRETSRLRRQARKAETL